MDANTIEKIQSLVHAAQIGTPRTDIPTILTPPGYSLESLERYQAIPCRFRGTYSTRSIEDFVAYVNEQDQAQVFVDIDDMDALAFFDLGRPEVPGHAEHRASLKLQETAPFQAMLRAHDSAMGQKELAHWIEDWHAYVDGESSGGVTMTSKQLAQAVRRIEVKATSERTHEEGDWNSQRTGLDALDASAGQDTPAFIRFTCQPYEWLQVRTFDLRLSILTDDQKPRIKLRIMGLEGIQEEIATEFKAVLGSTLAAETTSLLLGNFTPQR